VLLLLSNRKTCKRKAGIDLGRSCISGKPIASLMSMSHGYTQHRCCKERLTHAGSLSILIRMCPEHGSRH